MVRFKSPGYGLKYMLVMMGYKPKQTLTVSDMNELFTPASAIRDFASLTKMSHGKCVFSLVKSLFQI